LVLSYHQAPNSFQQHTWSGFSHALTRGTKAYSSEDEFLLPFRTTLLFLGNLDQYLQLPRDSQKADGAPITHLYTAGKVNRHYFCRHLRLFRIPSTINVTTFDLQIGSFSFLSGNLAVTPIVNFLTTANQ